MTPSAETVLDAFIGLISERGFVEVTLRDVTVPAVQRGLAAAGKRVQHAGCSRRLGQPDHARHSAVERDVECGPLKCLLDAGIRNAGNTLDP